MLIEADAVYRKFNKFNIKELIYDVLGIYFKYG